PDSARTPGRTRCTRSRYTSDAGCTSQSHSSMTTDEATYKTPLMRDEAALATRMSMRMMLVASAAAYFINGFFSKAKYAKADEINFEAPLTSLVWITSFVSIGLTYLASWLIIPELGGDTTQWWKLATIIT